MKADKNSKQDKNPLSTTEIKKLKTGSKDLSDTGENAGLRVTCGALGTKTFFYRYKSPVTGKLVQIKIGNYPTMKLAEARQHLQELKSLRKSGRCPKTEMEKEKEASKLIALEEDRKREVESFTMTDMVELYLQKYIEDRFVNGKKVKGARVKKGQAECRRTLYGDAVRVFGDQPAASVTRKQIVEMIRGIVDRGAPVQAGNVLRELTLAYNFAVGYEYFDDDFINPAMAAKEQLKLTNLKLTSTPGDRWLTDEEIRLVLNWLPGSGFSVKQKNIIRLSLWTGMRSGVVVQAEWHEIDFNTASWFVPKEKSKTDTDQFVQLPTQAVAFLKQLRLQSEGYVFPSERTGGHIQQKSLTETKWHLKNPDKVKNGRKYKPRQLWLDTIEDWAPHDLRRTVRTGLARLGCSSEIAEAVVGHSKRGIEGTYNLHRYEPECKIWLQKWADHLDKLMAKNMTGICDE